MDGKLYFGGMSTDIELKALMDAYGEAETGTLIPHEDLESLVGSERNTNRFRTVVARWKRTMFAKCNLEVAARPREGYVVLTPSERVQKASDDTKRIQTGLRRVHYRFAAVPREQLSQQDARRADYSQVMIAKLCDEMASARKQISPPSKPDRGPTTDQ